MTKKLFQSFMIMLLPLWAWAEPVDMETALQKAQHFLPGKTFIHADKSHRMKSNAPVSKAISYYVFNVEDNGGFVIVSGDDRTKEILAYSENGNLDPDNAPSNVRWLLSYYERVFLGLDENPQQSFAKSMRKTTEKINIAPFITTTWGQGSPYNTQCPTIGDEHCVTGCVATAMAQVMNYMQCPEGETSSLGDYTTNSYQIAVDALPPTSFEWGNMTDDDIARLMRYCGQAVQMDYGLDESGAYEYDVPSAMMSCFSFDSEMSFAYPGGFGDGWEDFIYNELAEGRPVIYGATSDMGRHSFICNGYKDGMFYINWGWDGNFNGYYELSLLDVTDGIAYNYDHCAIVNIRKSTGTPVEDGNGRTFTAQSPEGITLTFSVISESGKTCRVGFSDNPPGYSAIDESVTGTLTIPSEVEGYRVISIGYSAFSRNNLSEIILPETITKIMGSAFANSFELPSITIPRNVAYICDYDGIFAGCPKLKTITVDEDNPVYDSRESCNAVIHSNTNRMVAGCGTTTIPRTVTYISTQALVGWEVEHLFVHKDLFLGYGGWFSFDEGLPNLESIVVEEGNPYYASPDGCNAIIDMENGELLLGCSQTIIPSGVIDIASQAFIGNKKIKSINIPEGVIAINSQAFLGCENLEEVNLPSTLTYIVGGAFSYCNLKSIHIPDGIEELDNTFYYNNNLTTFTGGNNLRRIGNGTFAGCGFESFTVGNKVEVVGDAFERCSRLKSLFIPKGVKSIGRNIVMSCESLESIIIEEGNTIYDSRDNCDAIIETATNKMIAGCKNTTLPDGINSISDYCFWECYDLKELYFPESLEKIGNYAFYCCESLQTVRLPRSLNELGDGAFNNCLNLTSVVVEWTEPIPLTSRYTFSNCANCTLYVPYGSKAAYEAADYWKDFKEIIEIKTVNVGSTGLATFCSSAPLDFTGVSGLKAYIASGFEPSTGTLDLTRVLKVPAGEGLYLVGDAGTYSVPVSETDMVYSNLLKGVTTATTINPTDGSNTNFILANGSHGVGFYTLSAAGELAAGKAYLQIPTASLSSGVKAIYVIFDDDETAIQSIQEETNAQGIYNLQGQQVNAPKGGLYIINGKKVLVK